MSDTKSKIPATPPTTGRGFMAWIRLFWLGGRALEERVKALEESVRRLQEK